MHTFSFCAVQELRDSCSTPPVTSPSGSSIGSGVYDEVDGPPPPTAVAVKSSRRFLAVRRTESAMVLRNLPRLPLQAAEAPAVMGRCSSVNAADHAVSPLLLDRSAHSMSTGFLGGAVDAADGPDEAFARQDELMLGDERPSSGTPKKAKLLSDPTDRKSLDR